MFCKDYFEMFEIKIKRLTIFLVCDIIILNYECKKEMFLCSLRILLNPFMIKIPKF